MNNCFEKIAYVIVTVLAILFQIALIIGIGFLLAVGAHLG